MIRYALVGLVQGITEFLPVSSSGHLVLAERWLGLVSPGVLLEAMVHWGTLLAVVLCFRKDLWSMIRALGGRGRIEERKLIGYLIAGTVPIVVLGLFLRGAIEDAFTSVVAVGIGLLATACVLVLAHAASCRARRPELRFSDSLIVGVAQALSVFPGVSRSGSTIAAGVLSGISPERATRFSFLLSVPALFGAGFLHLHDALRTPQTYNWWGILLATVVAFGVGWLAIRALLALVLRRKLWVFAIYCLVLGTGVLVWQAVA